MNELSSYLRRTLCEAWRNGYGEEARRAAIVAPLLTLKLRPVPPRKGGIEHLTAAQQQGAFRRRVVLSAAD